MSFYKPVKLNYQNIPLIVYPCQGLEKVLQRGEENVQKHIDELYSQNKEILKRGEYHILILWNEASDYPEGKSINIMSDIWIVDKIESWGSGPLIDVAIFRDYKRVTDIGISAGDGLIMLGREEEFRRKCATLNDYLNGQRPQLPFDLSGKEEF